MVNQLNDIGANYERYYARRRGVKVYPTEFVVRTFLASYPALSFDKPKTGDKVLDVGFGDGRNTTFLCDLGLDVSGIEITRGIVDQTSDRLAKLGHTADLRVGRNSSIPFEADYFDYILACHSCYYCDEGETFEDNLAEYARVMNKGGYLIASVADKTSFIFDGAEDLKDGSSVINCDPYGNRNGYRLHGITTVDEIRKYFSPYFKNFSFGHADNDYYGISERIFWVVCQKKGAIL